MAGQDADQSEKTEEPTPYKLREAKKKGTVFKSQEVGHLAALLVGLILLVSVGQSSFEKLLVMNKGLFLDSASLNYDLSHFSIWGKSKINQIIELLSPIVFAIMFVGILVNMLQTGFVFTFFPIKPDIKRINPIEGFKRLFSLRLLFDSIKSIVKLVVITVIAALSLEAVYKTIFLILGKTPGYQVEFFITTAAALIGKLLAFLALIAILDFLFSRREYMKKMRMTKKELKDEVKRREGDPQIKSKRKEIEKELRKKSSSLSNVQGADLVITNPTHYAVVVKYDRDKMIAPKVVGKGTDKLALQLREKAYLHKVPVIQNPPLARELYANCQIDGYIPEESYRNVAKALKTAYAIKARYTKAVNRVVS